MEAIGGQGANAAGKILAETASLNDFSAQHLASFGSEKRGSPIRSSVRIATLGQPLRSSESVAEPDLLVLFDEHSLQTRSPELLEGCSLKTDIIINTPKHPMSLHFPKNLELHRLIAIDATGIAKSVGCRANTVLLGAIAHVLPEVPTAELLRTIEHFFSRGTNGASLNTVGFKKGLERTREGFFKKDQADRDVQPSAKPIFGFKDAALGGVILDAGNSILK